MLVKSYSYFDPKLLALRCFPTYFFLTTEGVIDLVRVGVGLTAAGCGNFPASLIAVKSSDEALHCLRGATGLELVILITGDKVSEFGSSGDNSLSEFTVLSSSISIDAIPLNLFDNSCNILLPVTCMDE